MLAKAAKMKGFQNSPLGSELKKQTGTAKDKYKFFKRLINVINNNREHGVKTEQDEIINKVRYRYIYDK